MEGVRNGVPFLCWPYFTDQFLNESYICNVWRTGLVVAPGADGVVTKEELSGKVERVIGDEGIRERVDTLRDAARGSIAEGGSSRQNFNKFVELLKE
jgi:UDP:flavonoid glycosyltransferase YjiC (YdhE family)